MVITILGHARFDFIIVDLPCGFDICSLQIRIAQNSRLEQFFQEHYLNSQNEHFSHWFHGRFRATGSKSRIRPQVPTFLLRLEFTKKIKERQKRPKRKKETKKRKEKKRKGTKITEQNRKEKKRKERTRKKDKQEKNNKETK